MQTRTRHGWAALILLLVALAMYLPGFATLPPMDRDEPRFAQASKQMLETGDMVAIRYQDEARNKKPVGIYWLQATAVALGESLGVADARRAIWLYRLPSLLGAVAAVLGTYWAALALTSQAGAFLAALMLASTVLLTVEAHLAKTDAVLLATVVFAMGSLARVYLAARSAPAETSGPRRGLVVPAIFWAAIAVGLLVKGPITPMVPAFACVVLCFKERSTAWLKGLRVWPGLALTLLLVLPWFVLILLRTKGAFLADSVGHDMLGKVASAQEAHGAPPGTYLAAFWGTAWPMTPFVALAIPAVWRHRATPAVAFCLAWLLPTWLLFEAVSTKLPHYVLPVYPALAILAAGVLVDRDAARPGFGRTAQILVFGLIALMPLGILVVLAVGRGLLWDGLPWSVPVLGVAAASGIVVLAYFAARMIGSGDLAAAVLAVTGAALLAYVFVLGRLLAPEAADRLFLSNRLATESRLVLAGSCPSSRFASVGDHEPSLVFLTGTDLFLTDAAGAAGFLAGGPCRGAFVERRAEAAFTTALAGRTDVRLAKRVGGMAINGAKSLDIGIYVRQEQRP